MLLGIMGEPFFFHKIASHKHRTQNNSDHTNLPLRASVDVVSSEEDGVRVRTDDTTLHLEVFVCKLALHGS